MKANRLVLTICCATGLVFGLIYLLAMFDDASLPPEFFRCIVLIVAWPFAITAAMLHHDPPSGICWWVLLAISGLFWGMDDNDSIVNVTEAKAKLHKLVNTDSFAISRRGKIVGIYLSRDCIEALIESVELLSTQNFPKLLKTTNLAV